MLFSTSKNDLFVILKHFLNYRELANTQYSKESALETFENLSLNEGGKLSLPEMEAILRRKTKEALEEEEINAVGMA